MSKSVNLKAKLKAADRRRRRRGTTVSADVDFSSRPDSDGRSGSDATVLNQTDVVGVLTQAALRVAGRTNDLRDSAVIGALRALKNETKPNAHFTEAVHREMVSALDHAAVSRRERRQAASELLGVALGSVDSKIPDGLIRSLSLIVS